ncbi:hypothetical protein R1sor_027179 [Riccia sorocarpa]|uniref:Endonuclease/exonuclease/phosphatase domain-containing protein n=1 Tax=Riccia sorocarpa TaxID=122646 RepID=A0ABD3GH60_9MARC
MEALETRMRTYAEVTRETHVEALREQEREKSERTAKEVNLRVVGLTESADEDTQKAVTKFFKESLRVVSPWVEQAMRVGRESSGSRTILGGYELWQDADIVALAETWEYKEREREMPGFTQLTLMWNPKRFERGRGFEGIAVWVKTDLAVKCEVEFADPHKQFLTVKLLSQSPAFVIFAYFAPLGSHVYHGREESDPFVSLSQEIIRCQELGPVFIVGDFNGRIGLAQGEEHENQRIWEQTRPGGQWERTSQDRCLNRFGEALIRLLNVCSLTVLNGTKKFPGTDRLTFQATMGGSVVDFVLVTGDGREQVDTLSLLPWQLDSDHCPVKFSL